MKKIYAFIAAAFMAISASAQSEAGSFTLQPNVGVTYSTVTGDGSNSTKGAVGLTAGVEGMYMVNNKFGVALGLNYTGYNYRQNVAVNAQYFYVSEDGSYGSYGQPTEAKYLTGSNYYFNIPVTANYYVAPGLALKAGIAMNILSTAKFDGKSEASVIDAGGWKYKGLKPKEYFKSTFFSLPVGASYEINNFVFDLRYNFGLGKAWKGDGSFNALSFTAGYKF